MELPNVTFSHGPRSAKVNSLTVDERAERRLARYSNRPNQAARVNTKALGNGRAWRNKPAGEAEFAASKVGDPHFDLAARVDGLKYDDFIGDVSKRREIRPNQVERSAWARLSRITGRQYTNEAEFEEDLDALPPDLNREQLEAYRRHSDALAEQQAPRDQYHGVPQQDEPGYIGEPDQDMHQIARQALAADRPALPEEILQSIWPDAKRHTPDPSHPLASGANARLIQRNLDKPIKRKYVHH